MMEAMVAVANVGVGLDGITVATRLEASRKGMGLGVELAIWFSSLSMFAG